MDVRRTANRVGGRSSSHIQSSGAFLQIVSAVLKNLWAFTRVDPREKLLELLPESLLFRSIFLRFSFKPRTDAFQLSFGTSHHQLKENENEMRLDTLEQQFDRNRDFCPYPGFDIADLVQIWQRFHCVDKGLDIVRRFLRPVSVLCQIHERLRTGGPMWFHRFSRTMRIDRTNFLASSALPLRSENRVWL